MKSRDRFISVYHLMRLSEKVINDLWYIPEFARPATLFQAGTRIPPLFYIFWDNIIINHTLRKILRLFVHERRETIHDDYRCLQRIRKMRNIAERLLFDTGDFDFQYDTFKILALAREYYFGEWHNGIPVELDTAIAKYRAKYPDGFHIICDFNPVRIKKWLIKSIFRLTLRRTPRYRFIDRFFLLNFASLVYPLFHLWKKRRFPAFSRNQAMGIETLFK